MKETWWAALSIAATLYCSLGRKGELDFFMGNLKFKNGSKSSAGMWRDWKRSRSVDRKSHSNNNSLSPTSSFSQMCIIYYLDNRIDKPGQLLSHTGNQMSGPGQGWCRSCGCLRSLRYSLKKCKINMIHKGNYKFNMVHKINMVPTGAGGPRGAIPRLKSGGAVVRRYPSSKVRSSGCALLEQPWRDTPCPR